MKIKDWYIVIGTAAYSIFFFHQNAGINFLLFTLILIALLQRIHGHELRNKNWLFHAVLALLASLFVLFHGSSLAILGSVISLFLLSAVSVNKKSSVMLNLLSSAYSVVAAIPFMVLGVVNDSKVSKREGEKSKGINALIYISVTLIVVLFFAIYKKANPLFDRFTDFITFDFISIHWVLFTIGGFILVYAFIRHARIKVCDDWESAIPLKIDGTGLKLQLGIEKKALLVLFVLLNFMLLFINGLDLNYLYLGQGLPAGITHKQFVHDGVNMLILSILLGIGIVLYAFKGGLNFDTDNKMLKLMVYFWILQNILMVISTGLRNHLYIHEALLTYKRIGVYYWLVLAAIGLMSSFYKIYDTRSNWSLFRLNAVIANVILVLSAGVDWDQMISKYNLERDKNIASLDKKYLISLSESNLKELYALKYHPSFETDSVYHYEYKLNYRNRPALDKKLDYFLWMQKGADWRSFNFRRRAVIKDIEEMNTAGVLDTLYLGDTYVKDLEHLLKITELKKLELGYGFEISKITVKQINAFPKLSSLSISSIKPDSIKLLHNFTHLKELHVRKRNEKVDSLLKDAKLPLVLVVQ